jgi:hypothetical protein
MHPNKGADTDEGINEGEHISIDKCINLTEELIKGLEQKSFTSDLCIRWIYKIQEVLPPPKKSLNA